MHYFRKIIIVFIISISIDSCTLDIDSQEIIDQSIAISGGERYQRAMIQFDFRDKKYILKREDGEVEMSRASYEDKTVILDLLKNGAFQRFKNDTLVEVPDSMALKYTESINSVIYFAILPFPLNDPAVKKEYLLLKELNGEYYHKVRITFSEEEGGVDFQDVYVYWINASTYNVDFLAYSFKVNGGGYRFREAYNERLIGGIRFVDYINYKPTEDPLSVDKLDELFLNGKLKELSKIELENISVSL